MTQAPGCTPAGLVGDQQRGKPMSTLIGFADPGQTWRSEAAGPSGGLRSLGHTRRAGLARLGRSWYLRGPSGAT